MKRLMIFFTFLLSQSLFALSPTAPTLTLTQNGFTVEASWANDSHASGYLLYYADYPSMQQVNHIDLGKQNKFSAEFPNGSALFIAVSTYNEQGISELSNIEHFSIDNKILVLLGESADREVMLSGLQDAMAGNEYARLEIIEPEHEAAFNHLFWGINDYENNTEQAIRRGYIDDPNVLAVITDNTRRVFDLTRKDHHNPPLILATTATSSFLNEADNVVLLPPQNRLQAKEIMTNLESVTQDQMLCYNVLIDSSESHALYSHDLYLHLISMGLELETTILDSKGIALDTQETLPFAQLCATIFFNGENFNAETIAQQLDVIQTEAVFYFGASQYFKTFYDQRPDLIWVAADGNYQSSDFLGGKVAVVNFKNTAYDYGYDAGGFLNEIMNSVSNNFINRNGLLNTAKETVYQGRTGIKAYFDVDNPGEYGLFVPDQQNWVLLPDF